jgi:hypothetical protein
VNQTVIAAEGNVLRAERRDMGKQIIANNLTLGTRSKIATVIGAWNCSREDSTKLAFNNLAPQTGN